MRGITLLCSVLAIGMVAGSAGAAETTIRVGDTIAITAFGFPELDRKAVVEKSGEISYPLLGAIKVAGLTVGDLRRKIIDGVVGGGLARDPKIGVEIAEREPFYVTGDVIKPGANAYTMNVTVRSAIALAGGLNPGGARTAGAGANPADLQGQFETMALEYVKQRARVRRLEAEHADKKTIVFDSFRDLPVAKDVVEKLNALESEQHAMAADDDNAEKAHLQKVIADTQAQIEALTSRRSAEEGSIQQETSQVSKVKGLMDRGLAVEGRLLEQQRLTLAAQGKLFETTATLASTNRLLEDYQFKLHNLDQTRRLNLVKELQDATIAAAAAEARLSAVRLQLNVKGGTASNQPVYVIYRESDDARIRIDADEDSNVQPGDIIEVRFGAVAALAAQ